jgi:hypothetical protein
MGLVLGFVSLFALANPPGGLFVNGTYTTPSHSGTIKFTASAAVGKAGYQGIYLIDNKPYAGLFYNAAGGKGMLWLYGASSNGTSVGASFVKPQTDGTFSGPVVFTSGAGKPPVTGTTTVTVLLPL